MNANETDNFKSFSDVRYVPIKSYFSYNQRSDFTAMTLVFILN